MMEGTLAVRLPKAVLHDHLDGGLRISTLLELADEVGYDALPATTSAELATAMHQANSGSLERYLAAFEHTVAVMQTAAAIERVAYESAIDHHLSGVAYAEVRFGPALLTHNGLSQEETIGAALAGLRKASDEVGIETALIISALRQEPDSLPVAKAAAGFSGHGVVGFDLAGPEAGFPPSLHTEAIEVAMAAGLGITIHAGEGAGPESIAGAVACGAQRIGHGVRIIEDCKVEDGEIVDLGDLAQRLLDAQIPLEIAITSNIHTGIADTPDRHPFGMLHRAGFNVSINTDNRLMSGINMAEEFALASEAFDLTITDLAAITERTLAAGFGDSHRLRELSAQAASQYSAARAAT